eukprot:183882-Amphidinium_carterae.4
MDSGASHMLLPLSMLTGKHLKESTRIRVNLAVGYREGRMFRDEVYADAKVHKLVPIGRIIDSLGLTLLWSKRGGELRCPDCKKTHLFTRFMVKGSMQTENLFEILKKALWTSAIDSVKTYDATFWRDAIRNGFDKYLQQVHDYPQTCYASISFTYDRDMDRRCELATSACRELESLLETETIPSGTWRDNVRSLLLGAHTKQGAGCRSTRNQKAIGHQLIQRRLHLRLEWLQ